MSFQIAKIPCLDCPYHLDLENMGSQNGPDLGTALFEEWQRTALNEKMMVINNGRLGSQSVIKNGGFILSHNGFPVEQNFRGNITGRFQARFCRTKYRFGADIVMGKVTDIDSRSLILEDLLAIPLNSRWTNSNNDSTIRKEVFDDTQMVETERNVTRTSVVSYTVRVYTQSTRDTTTLFTQNQFRDFVARGTIPPHRNSTSRAYLIQIVNSSGTVPPTWSSVALSNFKSTDERSPRRTLSVNNFFRNGQNASSVGRTALSFISTHTFDLTYSYIDTVIENTLVGQEQTVYEGVVQDSREGWINSEINQDFRVRLKPTEHLYIGIRFVYGGEETDLENISMNIWGLLHTPSPNNLVFEPDWWV